MEPEIKPIGNRIKGAKPVTIKCKMELSGEEYLGIKKSHSTTAIISNKPVIILRAFI